jgi:hypothetical protein
MSGKVSGYVWDHSTAKGNTLLVHLCIADAAHHDGTGAYPSVEFIARRIKGTERTVQRALRELEKAGDILIDYNAGRHGVNVYSVPMEVGRQIDGGDTEGTEGVTIPVEGGDTTVTQTLREPLREPSSPILMEPDEVYPDWYSHLWAIPTFTVTYKHAAVWLKKKGIGEAHAEQTALSLKGQWPGKWTDVWATFQSWVMRPPLASRRNGGNGAGKENHGFVSKEAYDNSLEVRR